MDKISSELNYNQFKKILKNNEIKYNELQLDESSIMLITECKNNNRVFKLTVFKGNPGSFQIGGWDNYTATTENAIMAYQMITGDTLDIDISKEFERHK